MGKQPLRLDDLIDHVVSAAPDDTPLQHLSDSVLLSDHLGELADHVVGHFVDQARDAGASWAEIGGALGVTKQAAQKRFVSRPSKRSGRDLPRSLSSEIRPGLPGLKVPLIATPRRPCGSSPGPNNTQNEPGTSTLAAST